MEDLGGGAMLPLRSLGINESGVMESLRAGVDLITYSGDKMLGWPGKLACWSGHCEELVKTRLRSNPLFRALRVDKLTYAALEGTLKEYVRQNHDAIPYARKMRLSAEEIRVADGQKKHCRRNSALHRICRLTSFLASRLSVVALHLHLPCLLFFWLSPRSH